MNEHSTAQLDRMVAMDGPVPRILNFVNGEWRASGKVFKKTSPVTGELVSLVDEADQDLVDQAIAAAATAVTGDWGYSSVEYRCQILDRIADQMQARFDDLVDAEMADTGRPLDQVRSTNVERSITAFRLYANEARTLFERSLQFRAPDNSLASSFTTRHPRGVVAVIAPWNVPLLLLSQRIAPALAAGNAIVAKPSEESPASATLLAEIMQDAGLPDGVFNLLHGFGAGSTGEMIVRDPRVAAIAFTGETTTGATIMRSAADGLRDVSLELGGKNASLVFADADLEAAVAGTIRSAFTNSGQICFCTERVYVERSIFDKFVDMLGQATRGLRIGAPREEGVAIGPLISAAHRDKVLSYYNLARTEGGTFVAGGSVPKFGDARDNGHFVEPTVVTGLADDSRFMREEIFGPVCHVAPFDSDEEAIRLANNTRYGLAAVMWSTDLARVHRLSGRLRAGAVWVNCWQLRDMRTPLAGHGLSGVGVQGGKESLDFYSQISTVTIKC